MIVIKGNKYRYIGKIEYHRGKVYECKGFSTGYYSSWHSMTNGHCYSPNGFHLSWELIKPKFKFSFWK